MTYERRKAASDLRQCLAELNLADEYLKQRITLMKRSITRAFDAKNFTLQELFEYTSGKHELLGIKDTLDLTLLIEEVHDEENEAREKKQ